MKRQRQAAEDTDVTGLVHRLTPLPVAPATTRLVVAQTVIDWTQNALRGFKGQDGRHEGIAYWAGRRVDNDIVIVTTLLPSAEHGKGFVRVSHAEVGWMNRTARRLRLVVLAQIHSHPGDDTRHSDGDDTLVVLPSEGMFSLVVGRYGDGSVDPRHGAGLHQFQDGRWVQVAPVEEAFIDVPSAIRP
jgi:proteasome lid subunit RPN8/RPN11